MSQEQAKLGVELDGIRRFLEFEYLNWADKRLSRRVILPVKPEPDLTQDTTPEVFLGFLEGLANNLVAFHRVENAGKEDFLSPVLLDSINHKSSKEDINEQFRKTGSFKDMEDSRSSHSKTRVVLEDSKDLHMKTTNDQRSDSAHRPTYLPPLKKVVKLTDEVERRIIRN